MPLVILLAAGALSLWSNRATPDDTAWLARIEQTTREVCATASEGGDMTGLPASVPISGSLRDTLMAVCTEHTDISFKAGTGTGGPGSGGQATHHVLIEAGGVTRLGLAYGEGGDGSPLIVGFWVPPRQEDAP